jgi:hypothetical protein
MKITHKKATNAEKRELKKIAKKLPEIVVPIEVQDFEELNGEMIPVVDMGRIDMKGHFHNLVDSMEQGGVSSVQDYVNAVNKRYEQNTSTGEA